MPHFHLDTTNDRLVVSFADDGRDHSLSLPFTEAGMLTLRRILYERALPPGRHGRKIGTVASPTAAMVEEFLKTKNVRRLSADTRQAREDVRYFELFEDDLDLGEVDI